MRDPIFFLLMQVTYFRIMEIKRSEVEMKQESAMLENVNGIFILMCVNTVL